MKSYYNKDTNCIVQAYFGKDVVLPNNSDKVEIAHYAKNNLLCVKQKTNYSDKLKKCNDVKALIDELTHTSPQKKHCNNSDIHNRNEKKSCDNLEDTVPKKAKEKIVKKSCDNSENSPEFENCIEKNGAVIDMETGEIISCRSEESLHRRHNKIKQQILNCIPYKLGLFISIHLDTKPTFHEMSELVAKYATYVKKAFKGKFDCGFIFLEPCEDGSWHVHLIVGFKDFIPDDFEEKSRKWWAKHNNNKTKIALEHQAIFQLFDSLDDLVKVINYLNPTSQKKRDRIKYYPLSSQPMRGFGNFSEPKKAITTYETAKKIAGSEKPAMRKKVTVIDAEIKAVLCEISEYYFASNIVTYQRQCKNHISENVEKYSEENTFVEKTVPHFSVTIYDEKGEQFGRKMTEVDFGYDVKRAIDLANFYERQDVWKGYTVQRFNVPLT